MPTPQELLESLKNVKYPGFSRDIVSFGMVKDITIGVSRVVVQIAPSTGNTDVIEQIRRDVLATLEPLVELPIEVDIQRSGAKEGTGTAPTCPATAPTSTAETQNSWRSTRCGSC